MDRNTRIAILGGGPAGLSAAMYLEKKGYENYTVFEKNNRVGGKCYSPKYKDGRAYEMGAIMGCPTYFAVQEVMDFTGYGVDGPALVRQYKNKDGKVIDPFSTKNVLNLPLPETTEVFAADPVVPAWAERSVIALSHARICLDCTDYDRPLTRREAANLLYAADQLL